MRQPRAACRFSMRPVRSSPRFTIRASAMLRKGRTLILIGHAGHPEVEGTMGQIACQGPSGPDRERCRLARYRLSTRRSPMSRRRRSASTIRAASSRRCSGVSRDIVGPEITRYLLRHAEPADRRARAEPACRRDPGRRRQEQLELQPAARDRRRGGRSELSHRRRQRARPRLGARCSVGRHHRRRLGAGGAGRGRHRRAAAHWPGRGLDAAGQRGKHPSSACRPN